MATKKLPIHLIISFTPKTLSNNSLARLVSIYEKPDHYLHYLTISNKEVVLLTINTRPYCHGYIHYILVLTQIKK